MRPPIFGMHGFPYETFRLDSADEYQGFTAAQMSQNGMPAIAAWITCEEQAVRYAFGGAIPEFGPGPNAMGHILNVGGELTLSNPREIRTFLFISSVQQNDGVLMVTMYFEQRVD